MLSADSIEVLELWSWGGVVRVEGVEEGTEDAALGDASVEGDGGGGEGTASPHMPGSIGERPIDPPTCRERLPSRGYVEKFFSGRWSYTPSPIRQTTSRHGCLAFLGVGGLHSADVTVSYADLLALKAN